MYNKQGIIGHYGISAFLVAVSIYVRGGFCLLVLLFSAVKPEGFRPGGILSREDYVRSPTDYGVYFKAYYACIVPFRSDCCHDSF